MIDKEKIADAFLKANAYFAEDLAAEEYAGLVIKLDDVMPPDATTPRPAQADTTPAAHGVGLDHLSLLTKYMTYVGDCEGIDFVHTGYRGYEGDQTFTPEEWAELDRISTLTKAATAPGGSDE